MAAWVIVMAHRHRLELSCTAGMMIAMAVAMMTSLLFGLIWGYLFQTMAVPTLLALGLGMLVGYTVGRPFHLMAALDGLLAGIMGGLMGPMLGVMVLNDLPLRVIFFCTWAYVLVMLVIVRLIQEEKDQITSIQAKSQWIRPMTIGLVSFITLLIGEAVDTDRSIMEVLMHWGDVFGQSIPSTVPDHHFHH